MTAANRSRFVYVAFIRTTPAKLWKALMDPEFTRQYWFDITIESGWKKGAPWKMRREDGSVTDAGELVEYELEKRMVIRWQNEWKPDLKAEGPSTCTIELQPLAQAVKLTIIHEMDRPASKLIGAVGEGWPLVISNLKSLLETGSVAVVEHPGH